MRLFKTKEDLLKRVFENQDLRAQHIIFHKFISLLLNEKYSDKNYRVISSSFQPGKKSEFIIVDNKDETVVEVYQDETAFDVEITGLDKDNNFIVTKPDAFDRIWKLYEEINPEEEAEDKTFAYVNEEDIVELIDVSLIDPNPEQIREDFTDVSKLEMSIKNYGLIEPIKVKKIDNRYILIDGDRRLRAVKNLGWKKIRAIILKDDADLGLFGLILNYQRSEPNIISLAKKIGQIRVYIKKNNEWFGKKNIIPEEKLAKLDKNSIFESCKEIDDIIEEELGLSKKVQHNIVNILHEPEEIQERIKKGEFSIAEGIVTLNLDKDDLPEEFRRALLDAINRSKIIERIEKRARDTNNPDSKFLRYYISLEKFKKQIDLSERYIDKIDQKTYLDVRARVADFIKYLSQKFNIDPKEVL